MKLSPHKHVPVCFIKKTEGNESLLPSSPFHFLKGTVPRNMGYSHMTQGG